MSGDTAPAQRMEFDALIKEAEFIRNESLQCIQNVRNLTIRATYVAGFALPLLAGLVRLQNNTENIDTAPELVELLGSSTLLVQVICVGVSLACLAFLMIYVGTFRQIFAFAKYFRDHLAPAINAICGQPANALFHWENWLKANRSSKTLFVGDLDLAVEPLLITFYILLYTCFFLVISENSGNLLWLSRGLALVIGLLLLFALERFRKVLRDAAKE